MARVLGTPVFAEWVRPAYDADSCDNKGASTALR